MIQGAFGHDLGRPQGAAPMDQEHFGGKSSEKDCFFSGSVAAADHANRHIPIKRPVTSRAGGDPVSFELALMFKTEPLGGGTAGDDDRLRLRSIRRRR